MYKDRGTPKNKCHISLCVLNSGVPMLSLLSLSGYEKTMLFATRTNLVKTEYMNMQINV